MGRALDVSVVVKLVDRLTAPLGRLTGRLGAFGARIKALSISFGRLGVTMARTAARLTAAAAVATAGAAVGATAALKRLGMAVIDTGSQFEGFQVQLETSFGGSATKAKEAMAWVKKFAEQTPYDVAEVTDAFVRLRSYGLDPTTGLLERTGNMAAAMNRPLEAGVEAIADAVGFQFERLREFGITVQQTGNKVTFSYNKDGKRITETAKKTSTGVMGALNKIMDARFKGSMDRMSKTLRGIQSNLRDVWTNFKLTIAESGIFEWVKEQSAALLKAVKELEKDGTLKRWAQQISEAMVRAGESIREAVAGIDWDAVVVAVRDVILGLGELGKALIKADWSWVAPTIREVGDAFGYLEEKAGGIRNMLIGLGAALVSPMLFTGALLLARGLQLVGGAALFVARAVTMIPIVRAATLLGAAAIGIVRNWEAVKQVFVGAGQWLSGILAGDVAYAADGLRRMWDGLGTLASDAWGTVKGIVRGTLQEIDALLGTDLTGQARAAWRGLTTAAGEAWAAVSGHFERGWQSATQSLQNLGQRITADLGTIGQKLSAWGQSAAEAVGAAVRGALDGVGEALGIEGLSAKIMTKLATLPGELAAWARTGFDEAIAAVRGAFDRLAEAAMAPIGRIKAAWEGLKSLFSGWKMPSLPGASSAAPASPSPGAPAPATPAPGKQGWAPIGGSKGFAQLAPARPAVAQVGGEIVVRAAPGTSVERVASVTPRVPIVPSRGPVTARA